MREEIKNFLKDIFKWLDSKSRVSNCCIFYNWINIILGLYSIQCWWIDVCLRRWTNISVRNKEEEDTGSSKWMWKLSDITYIYSLFLLFVYDGATTMDNLLTIPFQTRHYSHLSHRTLKFILLYVYIYVYVPSLYI